MGLGERIKAVAERPMTVSGLHVVALRDNPQAEALIRRINEGLSKMRSDGTFGRVVSAHLRAIWDRI
jgi:ABC-type amino acid transport substrate-binding protein